MWLIVYKARLKRDSSSKVLLPALLFFCSFIVFFIHGVVVIQRIFLTLLPVFAIIIATSFEEVITARKFPGMMNLFFIGNLICLLISFFVLVKSSEKNNINSIHRHDLINHYYLFNFNAKEVATAAQNIMQKSKAPLYVWDDFGKTGIEYYLYYFGVTFQWYQESTDLHKKILVLSNNKKDLEHQMFELKVPYKRILNYNRQYCLYLLNDDYCDSVPAN
jgi:hypothetical protein